MEEGEEKIRGFCADCQGSGSMDRQLMGTEDPEKALQMITDEGNSGSELSHTRARETTVSVDIVQHTFASLCRFIMAFLFFSWSGGGGLFFSPGHSSLTHTHIITHTLRTTGSVELSPPGQAVKKDKVVSMFCSSYLCWRRHAA